MKINKFLLSALIALSFVASACQKAPQAGISRGYSTYSLQEISDVAQLDCASKLKMKMKTNQLNFDSSVESQLGVSLSAVAQEVKTAHYDAIEYSYDFGDGPYASELSIQRRQDQLSVWNRLTPTEKESADWFELSLEVTKKSSSNLKTQFSQTFRVTTACELKLNETTTSVITRKGNEVAIATIAVHPGTQAGNVQKTNPSYLLPEGAIDFTDIYDNPKSSANFKEKLKENEGKALYYPVPGLGVVLFEIKPSKSSFANDPNTSAIAEFESFEISFSSENKELFSGSIAFSKASQTIINDAITKTFHAVNEAAWLAMNLAPAEVVENKIEGSPLLFKTPGIARIQLGSNQPYSYANLKAYFTEEETLAAYDNWTSAKLLTSTDSKLPSTSAALVPAKSRKGTPQLQESPMVQVNHPEVLKLTETLRPYENENRVQMALRIAKLVTSTIKYDHASLRTGQIYPLSTIEVLDRKTGVCQHFANLFAAIARGVGLPTKIIVGYAVGGGSSFGHAWNEIEVEPGVWIPVEPQSPNLLIPSGEYLPSAESGVLETGENLSSDELKNYGLFRFNYKLLEKIPVQ